MAFEPISALLDVGSKLIDRLWPDPEKRAAAQLELLKLQQSGELATIAGQLEIGKAEASNPNVFVSGWRPFVGWTCASGLAIQFVIGPLVTWVSAFFGPLLVLPVMDMSVLMTLLVGMLGLGGMRTIEKLNGAQGNH